MDSMDFHDIFSDDIPPVAPAQSAEEEEEPFELVAPPAASVSKRSRKSAPPAPAPAPKAPKTVEDPALLRRRRRNLAVGVLTLAGVLAFAFMSQPDKSSDMFNRSLPAASPVPASDQPEAAQILAQDLMRAKEYQQVNGTFRGFAPTAPITGAAGDSAIVLAFDSASGCFFTGIAPGFNSAVKLDESGTNCTPSALAQVQAELDSSDTSVGSAAAVAPRAELTSAVEVAQYWANHNFVDGHASFKGLDPSLLDGAQIVSTASDGSWVLISFTSTNSCTAAKVTADSSTPVSC